MFSGVVFGLCSGDCFDRAVVYFNFVIDSK